MMMTLRHLALQSVAVVATMGGFAIACRHDVPGPTLPLPAPEVSPKGPAPRPIDTRKAKPKPVGHVKPDAGVSDSLELPPVLDAWVTIVRDAAQRK